MSPMTEISGCPLIVRSSCTRIRPARSRSAPVAFASASPGVGCGIAAIVASHNEHSVASVSLYACSRALARFVLNCCAGLLRRLLAGDLFCGVEGLECLAGGVVIGGGTEGGADAVAVELLVHRAEDAADGEADLSLAEVFDDAGEDRRRGVVDVADGRAVENQPPQRAPLRGEGGDVVDEAGGAGGVGAGAEPVDRQSFLGPRSGPDRGRLPVPGR